MGMIDQLAGFSFVGELPGRGRLSSGRVCDPMYS